MDRESPSLWTVLTQSKLGSVIMCRSRSGLMVYETFGAARSATLGWLRDRRKLGFRDITCRIVPIGDPLSLHEIWGAFPQNSVSSSELGTESVPGR